MSNWFWVLIFLAGAVSFWTLWYSRKPKKVSYKKPPLPAIEPIMGQPVGIAEDPFLPKKKPDPFGESLILKQLEENPPEKFTLEPLDD